MSTSISLSPRLTESRFTEALPQFTDLTLVLTERCNLRCGFCYVDQAHGLTMAREVAFRALELLVERAPPGAKMTVSFFGGEPLLEPERMAEIMAYGRTLEPDPARLRFATPTNGLLLDEAAEAMVARYGLRLAASIDSACGRGEHSLAQLGDRVEALKRRADIARMTVTPHNVDGLFDNVRAVYGAGFRRIMHQPALEAGWSTRARAAWQAQHERLADWACRRYERGEALPDLTVLEGIVRRLEGRAAAYCGAGRRVLAVDPEGRLFGCYRSVYDPRRERLVLADLRTGAVNEPLLAAYGRLDPARARPAEGSCGGCEARQGCTVYCAAAGHAICGDLRAVPADACALMRIQVSVCQAMIRRMRRVQRQRRQRARQQSAASGLPPAAPEKVGSKVARVAKVATAALALGLSTGAAACGGDAIGTSNGDGSVATDAAVQRDGSTAPDGWVGGLCPVGIDADVLFDGAVQSDAAQLSDSAVQSDGWVGGLCPVGIDAEVEKDAGQGRDGWVGGLCPYVPDGSMGGLC